MKTQIIAANGSVQNIPEIPESIKELYKTVWEIKQRNLIDMAADRGAYICQSQSLNLFIDTRIYRQTHVDAFSCLEKRIENGHVLFKNASCCTGCSVYSRKASQHFS
jgi:ribonucleotide reductase alpha subunit